MRSYRRQALGDLALTFDRLEMPARISRSYHKDSPLEHRLTIVPLEEHIKLLEYLRNSIITSD